MVEMLNKLKAYINSNKLCNPDDKILLAVSGGIDSVVMLDILTKANYSCAIAHCNFNLRGSESDEDEKFVKTLGDEYGIRTHTIQFDTLKYATENGISTQMAARELRYQWFAKLAEEFHYDYIAIAHNSDDNIETFHLNLARGTGLSGITGMEPKSGRIIRPLLWTGRKEISRYCKKNKLVYREDSSNIKTSYKRNYLRHEIIPKFNTLNPAYSDTILQNIEFFRQSSAMLNYYYEKSVNEIISINGAETRLLIKELIVLPEPSWFLFRFLSSYGFSASQIKDITDSINSESGKRFSAGKHILIKDRDYFILAMEKEHDLNEYFIKNPAGKLSHPFELEWKQLNIRDFSLSKDPDIASFDASKLTFPLKIRKWQEGDSFYPFGMTGLKKLSDFFVDNKLSVLDKERIWLLTSSDDIVWIIGHRIDNRFRISEETKEILYMRVFLNP